MIRVLGLAVMLGALALGLSTAGAGGDEKPKKKFDAETLFKKLDKNMDGKLTKDEFLQMANRFKDDEEKAAKAKEFLGKKFDELDTDKKGYLTLDQFKQFKPFPGKKKSDDK